MIAHDRGNRRNRNVSAVIGKTGAISTTEGHRGRQRKSAFICVHLRRMFYLLLRSCPLWLKRMLRVAEAAGPGHEPCQWGANYAIITVSGPSEPIIGL